MINVEPTTDERVEYIFEEEAIDEVRNQLRQVFPKASEEVVAEMLNTCNAE